MTTLQTTVLAATLATAVGIIIYEARQASNARAESETFKQQQASLLEQIQRMTRERDDFASKLAVLRDDNERLKLSLAEEYWFIRKVPVWIGGLVADLGHESELALPCVWRS